jgi:hypothetical protein
MAKKNFECKALFRLKAPEQDESKGLSWRDKAKPGIHLNPPQEGENPSWDVYQAVDCDYRFFQGVNRDGEVNTGLKSEPFTVSIEGIPSDRLLAWMFDHHKKYDGELSVIDAHEETLEKTVFEQARLVDLQLVYRADRKPNTVTELKLIIESLQIGDACFEKFNYTDKR